VKRTPIFGVGCAGGAVGLARAEDYLRGHPEETVLLLSVELCSLTFLPRDDSMIQLVGASLFGDGAAAVLLAGDKADHGAAHPVEILGSESLLLPDSLHVMGWDFTDEGMKLVLSREAPALIERHVKGAVDSFLEKHRKTARDIDYFLLHPGSLKIIEAFERALNLTSHDTRFTRRFLENYGNLSSASVLFILHDTLKTERPRPGSCGLLATMGPGFACEMLLLRFL
jgi:alkylresorcinol/alkylpyrone synthase